MKIKAIAVIVIALILILTILASVQLILNTIYLNELSNFINNIEISSDSIKNVVDVEFYGRLMHISSLYPTIDPDFSFYKKNISIVSSSLQSNQFELINKEIQLTGF